MKNKNGHGVSMERKMMLSREVLIVKIKILRGRTNGYSLDILHPVSISFHLIDIKSWLLDVGDNLFLSLLNILQWFLSWFFFFLAIVGCSGTWNGGDRVSDGGSTSVVRELNLTESIAWPGQASEQLGSFVDPDIFQNHSGCSYAAPS